MKTFHVWPIWTTQSCFQHCHYLVIFSPKCELVLDMQDLSWPKQNDIFWRTLKPKRPETTDFPSLNQLVVTKTLTFILVHFLADDFDQMRLNLIHLHRQSPFTAPPILVSGMLCTEAVAQFPPPTAPKENGDIPKTHFHDVSSSSCENSVEQRLSWRVWTAASRRRGC